MIFPFLRYLSAQFVFLCQSPCLHGGDFHRFFSRKCVMRESDLRVRSKNSPPTDLHGAQTRAPFLFLRRRSNLPPLPLFLFCGRLSLSLVFSIEGQLLFFFSFGHGEKPVSFLLSKARVCPFLWTSVTFFLWLWFFEGQTKRGFMSHPPSSSPDVRALTLPPLRELLSRASCYSPVEFSFFFERRAFPPLAWKRGHPFGYRMSAEEEF